MLGLLLWLLLGLPLILLFFMASSTRMAPIGINEIAMGGGGASAFEGWVDKGVGVAVVVEGEVVVEEGAGAEVGVGSGGGVTSNSLTIPVDEEGP